MEDPKDGQKGGKIKNPGGEFQIVQQPLTNELDDLRGDEIHTGRIYTLKIIDANLPLEIASIGVSALKHSLQLYPQDYYEILARIYSFLCAFCTFFADDFVKLCLEAENQESAMNAVSKFETVLAKSHPNVEYPGLNFRKSTPSYPSSLLIDGVLNDIFKEVPEGDEKRKMLSLLNPTITRVLINREYGYGLKISIAAFRSTTDAHMKLLLEQLALFPQRTIWELLQARHIASKYLANPKNSSDLRHQVQKLKDDIDEVVFVKEVDYMEFAMWVMETFRACFENIGLKFVYDFFKELRRI